MIEFESYQHEESTHSYDVVVVVAANQTKKATTTARRSVSFDIERTEIHEVPAMETTANWINNTETMEQINNGRPSPELVQINEDFKRFQVNRFRALSAILNEQERQRKANICDPDLLAEVYRGYSILSSSDAYIRAKKFIEVTQQQDKQPLSSSGPSNRIYNALTSKRPMIQHRLSSVTRNSRKTSIGRGFLSFLR